MSTPFKMAGMSFGNSPMKQDNMGYQKTPGKVVKKEEPKKYRLSQKTDRKTGETTYFKISGGISTDRGKTFTPTVETKISKATYNSMMGNK